jgi:hypothetical protein
MALRWKVVPLFSSLLLLATACGGEEQPAGRSSPSPSRTTPSSPQPTPLAAGPLAAGSYSYGGFAREFSFTVGEGWQATTDFPPGDLTKLAEFFTLTRGANQDLGLEFYHPSRIVDPAKDWDDAGNILPVPSDLSSWLANHPHFRVISSSSATIAGITGKAVDIDVTSARKKVYPPCGEPCVPLIPIIVDHETGPLTTSDATGVLVVGDRYRLTVINTGGQDILIVVYAPPDKFAEFLPLAEEVLATLSLGQ